MFYLDYKWFPAVSMQFCDMCRKFLKWKFYHCTIADLFYLKKYTFLLLSNLNLFEIIFSAPCENVSMDSKITDQHAHPRSLIRAFCVRLQSYLILENIWMETKSPDDVFPMRRMFWLLHMSEGAFSLHAAHLCHVKRNGHMQIRIGNTNKCSAFLTPWAVDYVKAKVDRMLIYSNEIAHINSADWLPIVSIRECQIHSWNLHRYTAKLRNVASNELLDDVGAYLPLQHLYLMLLFVVFLTYIKQLILKLSRKYN